MVWCFVVTIKAQYSTWRDDILVSVTEARSDIIPMCGMVASPRTCPRSSLSKFVSQHLEKG